MAKTNLIPKDQYFASLEDPIELANAMTQKITEWRTYCQARGLLDLWESKLSNYYGISRNGNQSQGITPGGSEGELSLIKVNDMHQLIQEQLVLVTSQRPAGQAKAVNSDSESLKSARIGTAIAEYYMTGMGVESKFISTAEIALVCDEGFVDWTWDRDAGDPIAVDPETGSPVMSGDAVLRVHCPWNVARDPGAPVELQKWHILSIKANKFDLAAKFPQYAEAIINNESDDLPLINMNKVPDGSDMIYMHLLVHDRSAAVPSGRYALMIANQIVYDDHKGLPFKDYPVDRMSPSDVIDGPTGYSCSNDLLGLEQITDSLHSIATSNNVTFGGQAIVGPDGANLNVTDLGKGLRYFGLPPELVDKLKPLQLTRTAPETYEYINKLEQKKQQQTGSSSGVLQQQAAQGASGSAMALVDSKSIQANSGVQRSYFRTLSSSMTKLIGILRSYADTPRIASIVGKVKGQGLKEFKYTGQDLRSVSTIVYEMVNPIAQTQGGRLQMAQDLINAGMIKSPKKYINVVTTGDLDSILNDDELDQLLIIEENEMLSEGQQVSVVITEMHPDHIKSHMSVLSSPKAKADPTIVNTTLAHIQDHINVWTKASMMQPGLLAALGIPPIPMPQPPAPPPGPAPGAGAPPPPQGPAGPAPQAVGNGKGPVQNKADEVKKPRLPTNPETHEEAVVPGANT